MKKQIKSFKNAISGIVNTIISESHMRFHIVAGTYVLLFSQFYDFSVSQICLLIVLIAGVMAAEIINTGIEELCNLTADRYEPLIKLAKDAAAGAVLIIAAASVAVAVILFINIEVIMSIISYFAERPVMLILFAVSLIASALFVALGPVGVIRLFEKAKKK